MSLPTRKKTKRVIAMQNKMLQRYLKDIEAALSEYVSFPSCEEENVCQAMQYALLDGGKRIRPVLTLEFCRVCGGEIKNAMPFACALEMIHSYSLIHDDLPCMDDDDMRRGKPSCHKKFGESTALLAGDALLTLAFETALSGKNEGAELSRTVKAAGVLAQAAGMRGMVGGQAIDLNSEGKSVGIETLKKMDEKKTGALIYAACTIGCITAGACEKQINAARTYAACIGLAFQIVDDILDKTSTPEMLGKPIGSDDVNSKSTYVSLLGIEESKRLVEQLTDEACAALGVFGAQADDLAQFARDLAKREK